MIVIVIVSIIITNAAWLNGVQTTRIPNPERLCK